MTIFWTVFGTVVFIHMSACFAENHRIRKITKVFLVPLLMLGAYLMGSDNALLYIGLFLGWLGDVILLSEKKKWFSVGALAFALGHFAYIAACLHLFLSSHTLRDIPALLLFAYGAVVLVLLYLAFGLRRRLGSMAWLGAAYFSILAAALIVSSLMKNYMLMAGFAMFILSDTLIVLTRFFKKIRRSHLYVMSTYILAQTLICLSLM